MAGGAVVLAGVLVSVGVVVSACEASVDNANTAPANTNALMDFFMCCLWLHFLSLSRNGERPVDTIIAVSCRIEVTGSSRARMAPNG